MLTPLPWRRPWKVASQVATLDQLSAGRAILAVGVGATDTDLPDTGEVTGLRDRAELLDEGIDLIRMLWEGGTSYHGRHYDYQTGRMDLSSAAKPVQPDPDLGGRGLASAEVDAPRAALRRGDPAVRPARLPSGRPPKPATSARG